MDFKDENELEKNQINSSEMSEEQSSIIDTTAEADSRVAENEFNSEHASFSNNEVNSKETDETKETVETANVIEGENTRAAINNGKRPRKGYIKGFVSMVAAGVVGSALTLTVLPHTDYLKDYYPSVENQSLNNANQKSNTAVKAVSAQPTAVSSSSIADTVENVSKAIVGIVNYQQQRTTDFFGNSSSSSQSVESGSGSGVIIQKKGNTAYIVTNNHVVEGASKLEISLYDGQKTTAEVVGTDALTDLAVLKIDSKYVSATADFGDSSTLRAGDQVYAIGNPLGLDLSRTVTQGIVSATNRSISLDTSAGSWDTNVIQTDAAINAGNSGGALINPQGQVIGINSLKISESGVEGLGFAIPSNDVIPIVNKLISNGKVNRPYLGVGLADLDQVPQNYNLNLPKDVTKGVLVMTVDPNSAAGKAGFKSKDVIVSMNGTAIANSTELRKYLYTKASAGDEIKFEVYRDGKLITLKATLTSNKGA